MSDTESLIPRFDDEHRGRAHALVDLLFDHVGSVEARPVVEWTAAEDLRRLVALGDQPRATASSDELMRQVARFAIQLHHPMYMGHQVCPPLPTAVLGDLLVSALNQSDAVWEMSPIATEIEKEVVRWLASRAGYPAESEGTAVSGGSAANLTALLAARARWAGDGANGGRRPVIVCSADSHYSVVRAASIMGIPAGDVVKSPTDATHRLDLATLETILDSLASSGDRSVLAIVATAGSTATGAFDDLVATARIRDRHHTWLHVDAAHGASVLLSSSLRHLVAGIDRADSLAWDPHKMLWMPLSLGIVLVRDGSWLRRAFAADAPYLFHAERAGADIGAMTIQCSKRADAVKLWLSLKVSGVEAFEAALDRVASVTKHLHRLVRESGDFEAMHEPEFNIFCFRWIGSGAATDEELDAANAAMRERLVRSGEAWITSTVLKGRRVLRVTIINPRTGPDEVGRMLDALRRIAAES
ncbi:MAG: pyridoxal phosphate-dependent decarboxylase family protein [Thermoanaerobaculia bacterium]